MYFHFILYTHLPAEVIAHRAAFAPGRALIRLFRSYCCRWMRDFEFKYIVPFFSLIHYFMNINRQRFRSLALAFNNSICVSIRRLLRGKQQKVKVFDLSPAFLMNIWEEREKKRFRAYGRRQNPFKNAIVQRVHEPLRRKFYYPIRVPTSSAAE